MAKTILITGATDGIGLETAKRLASLGHALLIHGRDKNKLAATKAALSQIDGSREVEIYRADLADMSGVEALADEVAKRHSALDVLINNAGVFAHPNPVTSQGFDLRFIVNTIAPYLLTRRLLDVIPSTGRVINLSSAAQAPVDLDALAGKRPLNDNAAYAQSKLAITMWSAHMAQSLGANGPAVIAVNPASFLGSKMVKDAYGVEGGDLAVGADILVRAALSDEFAGATGQYFDNDQGRFTQPHADALSAEKNEQLIAVIERVLKSLKD